MPEQDKQHQASELIRAHGEKIDELHRHLKPLCDNDAQRAKLDDAVKKYKNAHGSFVQDAALFGPGGG